MRLLTLRWKGITAFPEEVALDFTRLGSGLIALVGRNGAGKTTVMELSGPLTLFLRSVYYECAFIDAVRTDCRDAFSELTFALGTHVYALRVSGDAKTRKTEALLSIDGSAVAGPTLSDVRTHLDQVLPGLPLFLASAFAAQRNATSFFELSPAKRKDMLIETMQLGALQDLSEQAEARAKDVLVAIAEGRVQVATAGRAAQELDGLQLQQDDEQPRLADLDAVVVRDRAALQAAQQRCDVLAAEQRLETQRYEHAREAYDAAVAAHAARQQAITTLTARAQRLVTVAAGVTEKRAAAAHLDRLRAQHREATATVTTAQAVETDAIAQVATITRDVAVLRQRVVAVREAKAKAAQLADAVAGIDVELEICKVCPLTAMGRQGISERLAAVDEEQRLIAEGKAARAKATTLEQARDAALVEADRHRQAVRQLQQEITAQEGRARGLPEALAADAQLAEVRTQLDTLLATPSVEIPAAPVLVVTAPHEAEAALHAASAALRTSTMRSEALRDLVTRRAGLIEARQETAASLPTWTAALQQREADHALWTTLAKALGRDGIQALEIDAAGPMIQSLANELLVTCYGSRFALKFVTLEPKKGKGAGVKEVFECQILDAAAGRTVARGSGGEQVIIDEALRLALTIYAAMKSGREQRTLWRDESVGPLDPENATAYVAMLRRAMQLGGFEQCLLIAHTPEVWEACDAQIFVGDGAVRIAA